MGTARLNLLLLLGSISLSGCAPPAEMVSIPFRAHYAGQPVTCASTAGVALTDLRMYIHSIELRSSSGDHIAAELIADKRWQSDDIALLDLEDGAAFCANGSKDTNDTIRVTVPPGDYQGLRFSVGVPVSLNHADPLLAKSPLNLTAMHWHWRSGYKFLRAGMHNSEREFWLHLGSSRCRGTIGNIEGCDAANRVDVELPEYRPGADAVVFDLAPLFDVDTGESDSVISCSSGPGEAGCDVPFSALGLDFASGEQRRAPLVFARDPVE